jgi:hypothetical protein
MCTLVAPLGQSSEAASDPTLNVAMVQVREGEFASAIATLDELIRRLRGRSERASDLGRAFLYISAAHLGLGHDMPAREALRSALAADPKVDAFFTEFPPKFRDFFVRHGAGELPTIATAQPSPVPVAPSMPPRRTATPHPWLSFGLFAGHFAAQADEEEVPGPWFGADASFRLAGPLLGRIELTHVSREYGDRSNPYWYKGSYTGFHAGIVLASKSNPSVLIGMGAGRQRRREEDSEDTFSESATVAHVRVGLVVRVAGPLAVAGEARYQFATSSDSPGLTAQFGLRIAPWSTPPPAARRTAPARSDRTSAPPP